MLSRCFVLATLLVLAGAGPVTGVAEPSASFVSRLTQRLPVDKLAVILGLAALGGAVLLLLLFLQRRALNFQPRKKSRNMHHGRFSSDSLTPMVLEVLREYGTLFWGRNMPWSTNYRVYERRRRWILCDTRHDNGYRSATKIEICHRSACFKLKISRLDGEDVDIFLFSRDLSEGGLREGMEHIRGHLRTRRNDTAY